MDDLLKDTFPFNYVLHKLNNCTGQLIICIKSNMQVRLHFGKTEEWKFESKIGIGDVSNVRGGVDMLKLFIYLFMDLEAD